MSRLKKLIREIHRRSLWQVLGVYVVGSWLVLQVVDTLAGALNLPDWAPPFALFLLIIGLPIVLATAFIQEGARPAEGEAEEEVADSSTEPAAGSGLLTWRNAIVGAVGAALLWGGVAIGWFLFGRDSGAAVESAVAAEADPGIAVLPFTVSGSEVDALGEGLVHLLHSNLNDVGGLRAIAPGTVLAQWDRRVGEDERAELGTALEVAAASGGRYALVGSAVSLGARVRLEGTLYELPGASALGRVRVEGSPDSVWALVDQLAVEVVRALGEVGVGQLSGFDLAAATTSSLTALQAYLEGETYRRRGEFEVAIPAFRRAIEEDPGFALAEYRLGMSQGWLTLAFDEARGHLESALATGLPDREALFARATMAYLEGSLETLPELRAYVRSHPDDADGWFILGDALLHAGTEEEVQDWLEEGRRALDRAVELDPGFGPYLIHTLQLALRHGDSAHVAAITESYGAIRPGTPNDRVNRIVLREEYGSSDSTSVAAAVDTLSGLGVYPNMLLHSTRSVDLSEAYYLREAEVSGEIDFRLCLFIPLRDGDLRKLIEYATDPRLDRDRAFFCPYLAKQVGFPISDEFLDRAAQRLPREERERPGLFGATRAAERGDWEAFENVVAGLRDRLAAAEATGDTAVNEADWTEWETELRTAEAFGLMVRGRSEEAAAAFEAMKSPWWPNRWWLGRLYLELDRPRDAIRWLNTFVGISNAFWPIAWLYIGQAHEQLGEVEEARAAYASFVDMWQNADPELQPLVEEARDALARLGPMDQ